MDNGSNNLPPQPTPPPTPQPTPQPPFGPENNFVVKQEEPPRRKKGPLIPILIIIGIFIVLVGAAAGVALYINANQKDDEPETTAQVEDTSKAEELTDKVKAAIDKELKVTYPAITTESSTGAPAYSVPQKDYAVFSSKFGTTLSIAEKEGTPPATSVEVTAAAIEKVANDTLSADDSLKQSANELRTIYQSSSVVCTVSIGVLPVTVSCADVEDYAGLIKGVVPFAEAYLASDEGKQNGKDIAFSDPTVSEKANGYSNAKVSMGSTSSIGGFSGLFYAKDGNWAFWKGSQSLLPCSDYNSSDLQRSFLEEECFDTVNNNNATVIVTL